MSYRVGTPNYGLPQTEGTDKRDWSDTNQPFLLIDTAIKNAVDTSASASTAAATAQQTADSANTAAAHAQTDATTAQTLANSASELATIAKSKADNAYANVGDLTTLTTTAKSSAVAAINEVESDLPKFILDFSSSQHIGSGNLHGFRAPSDGVVFANILVYGVVDAWLHVIDTTVTPHADYHVYRFRYQGASVPGNSMPVMVPIKKGWAITYDQVEGIGDDASSFVPFANQM